MPEEIFKAHTTKSFENLALSVFSYQAKHNSVYSEYIDKIGVNINEITSLYDIPFLPISFFKTKDVTCGTFQPETIFKSSGTSQTNKSKHYIKDLNWYEKSFTKGFEHFYDKIEPYIFLAFLPSYIEQGDSSLIYMINHFIKKSNHPQSGFYLHNLDELASTLRKLKTEKVLLWGVSYALLDLLNKNQFNLSNTIIMETGGMKGRRKEITKNELHNILKKGFGVENIHSEYGMTELLSQAYSKGDNIFYPSPWMKILLRDMRDPLHCSEEIKNGVINVIDLANIHSCSFIATEDLGRLHSDGSFEVIGRSDNSEIRGCNTMI